MQWRISGLENRAILRDEGSTPLPSEIIYLLKFELWKRLEQHLIEIGMEIEK